MMSLPIKPEKSLSSTHEIRDLALQAADFSPELVGAFVRQATNKLIEKLTAKKVSYFAFEGEVKDERIDEDHTAQIKAASELIALGVDIMAMRRRATDEAPVKPNVVVDLSGWTVTPTTPPTLQEPAHEVSRRNDRLDGLDE